MLLVQKYVIHLQNSSMVYKYKIFQVFIYFARYLKGNTSQEGVKWLDRAELSKVLHPNYHKAVCQFLITE